MSTRAWRLTIPIGVLGTAILATTGLRAPAAEDQSPAPAAEASKPPAPPEAVPPIPKNLEPLLAEKAVGILGKKVIGQKGEDLGLVIDVVVDDQGRPVAAIIDFGGFLGVGSRKIAVDWQLLHFAPANHEKEVSLSLGRADIQGAPKYKPDASSALMVGPPPPETPAPNDAPR